MNNIACQKITLLIPLDLSAAFDTVEIEMPEIFEHRFYIKGSVLTWFKTYLNRELQISINKTLFEDPLSWP